MNIYLLEAEKERHQALTHLTDNFFEFADQFCGRSIGSIPDTVKLKLINNTDDGKYLLPTDFPFIVQIVPMFSQRAIDILGDLLRESGQVFPIQCEGEIYYAFNATNIIDAFDRENAEFKTFKNSQKIMRIVRYAFSEEKLQDVCVFKPKEKIRDGIFVTDSFKTRVEDFNLCGFIFRKVWSSNS